MSMESVVFMTLHKADSSYPLAVSTLEYQGKAFILPFDTRAGALFEMPDKNILNEFTGCVRGIDNVEFGCMYVFKSLVSDFRNTNIPIIRPDNVLIDAEKNPSKRLKIQRIISHREIKRISKLYYRYGFWKALAIASFPMALLCILCLYLFLAA